MAVSPRISKRFSNRQSILPPPAMDLLFESNEPVPQIPTQFKATAGPYELRLHPYAIRGLREYEESLDEYDVWAIRVLEEEAERDARELGDMIPRLSVAWPISFSDTGE